MSGEPVPFLEGLAREAEDPGGRELAALERFFAEKHLAMLATEAALLCEQHGRPWPDWLRRAMVAMALQFVAGDVPAARGRGKGLPEKNHRTDLMHFTRWDAVGEALEREDISADPDRPPTLTECCAAASKLLRGSEAQGSEEAMEAATGRSSVKGTSPSCTEPSLNCADAGGHKIADFLLVHPAEPCL